MKNVCNILYRFLFVVLFMINLPFTANAQKWAISTNVLSWLGLGTINVEGAYSLSQHISINTGVVVNPWEAFSPTNIIMRNNQYGGYVGAKYWPWHVYSEWWIGAKVQYKQFEQVGILTSNLVKGDAIGAGLSAGYSFMLGNHFNLDFGGGIWGGKIINYKKYKGVPL